MEIPRLKINVMGRYFELPLVLLYKMDYFRGLLETCPNDTKEIYVPRSPMLFEHIVAYLVAPDEYPYPLEYEEELRFYGIDYAKEKLYAPLARLDSLSLLDTLYRQANVNMMENLALENGLKNIFRLSPGIPMFCRRCGKNETRTWFTALCNSCQTYCSFKDCKGIPGGHDVAYCEIHSDTGKLCNHRDCRCLRITGIHYCLNHSNMPMPSELGFK